MRRAVALLALVLLTACATMDDQLKPYLGHPKRDVIAAWGPPMHEEVQADGNTVMYWSHVSGYRVERVWFYVNKNGIVYYYRWQTKG